MKRVFLEAAFFLALPLLVWSYGRPVLGDYSAILLSGLPGFCYGLYVLFKDRRFTFTGVFLLATLLIPRFLDLLSDSPEWLLRNNIYTDAALGLFFFLSIAVKRTRRYALFC